MPNKKPGRNVVSVLLSDQELSALRRRARQEFRSVASQAKRAIVLDLRQAGLTVEDDDQDDEPPAEDEER